MLLQICDFSGIHFSKCGNNITTPANAHFSSSKRNSISTFRCVSELACNSFSVHDIAGVLHNKVLVAACLSAAIGQFSKPLTSTLFYGKKFDIKTALQAGGFPSTHSSAVVATATSLVLERGFSDPVFGLAVIYAGLIMYDAQGVRREVGTHAKELNKVMLQTTSYPTLSKNDIDEDPNSLLLESDTQTSNTCIRSSERVVVYNRSPLKESIGHTEIEVAAGALLGFFVSLALCSTS